MKRNFLFLLVVLFSPLIGLADIVAPAGSVTYVTASGNDGITIESGGALQVQLPASGVLSSIINNSGVLGDFSSGTTAFSGAMSGTGAYAKQGEGTTIFSGANTYRGVTWIGGGMLQTGSAGTLSQASAVYIATSGTLDLHDSVQSVGSVSGSGAILMGTAALPENSGLVNTGSVITTGTNSVFGGSVSGGVLVIAGSGSIGTIQLYSGSATLTAGNQAGTGGSVITGGVLSISGGGLIKGTQSDSGTTVISTGGCIMSGLTIAAGGNLLVGGEISGGLIIGSGTILGGSLTLGPSAGSLGSISCVIGSTLSGTLNVPFVSGGSLFNDSGASILIDGTLTLSSSSTATWTTGTDGTVTFTSGSTVLGSIPFSGSTFTVSKANQLLRMLSSPLPPTISSTGNAILITGYDNLNTVYSGTISGNGQVVKTGTGTWNFTGANTSPGMMTVASGALLINGTTSGDVLVWGGYLGGSGYIGGSLLNESIVSPGNSPGTLTIAGDYAQSASGYLLIQIASTSVYDHMVVGGKAYLDGSLFLEYLNGFTLRRGESFSFLTAAGGVSGSFAQIIVPDTVMSVSLMLDGTTATLNAVQGAFVGVPGLTPNEKAVAQALDRVVNSPRLNSLVDHLDSLNFGSLRGALDKIAPTDLLPMFDAGFVSADVQMDNLERRLEEVRGGSAAWSCAGLRLGNCPAATCIDPKGNSVSPRPMSDRWGFFANGSGEFVDANTSASVRGYNFQTNGVSAGADYRWGDHAVLGAVAGYANTSGNDRSVQTDSGKLGLYGSVYSEGFFANAMLGGGVESYDTRRDSVGGNAHGSTDGNELNASLGGGYTYREGGLSVGPVTSVRYSQVRLDSFTEHGSLAPLHYGDQSEESLRSLVGAQIAYVMELQGIGVKPQLRAQWSHQYLDDTRALGAEFLPGGGFTVNGPALGRDSLLLDAGVSVRLRPEVTLNLFYTGDLGRSDYTVHSVNGGVEVRF